MDFMTEHSKTWFRLRWRTLFLLAVLGIVGWSAYSYWSEYSERAARKARVLMAPAVGAHCTVVFHSEATGNSSDRPAPTQAVGKFVKLNDDWIVLSESEGKQLWVSREQVLLMRVEEE